MASLNITGLPGDQVAGWLRQAATIAGQRGIRPCDITLDLTAGLLTTTENLSDTGKKVHKN
jgi:hypothetical protein